MAQNLNTCDQTIMKKSKFILLTCIVAISLAGCQKNEEPSGTPPQETLGNSPEELLFKGYNLLNLGHKAFYEFADKNNGNASLALYQTGKSILDTGIPQEVYIVDSIYMYIVMSTDITMILRINYVDEDGKSVYRGGPDSGNHLMKLLNNDPCSNAIPNKKVLLWGAAHDLALDYYRVKETLSESDLEFEVTELMQEECTSASLKTLNEYGLVLLDTHGRPDGILLGSQLDFSEEVKNLNDFNKAMVASLSEDGYNDFLNGEFNIGWSFITPETGGEEWWKSGETIQKEQRLDIWADMDFLEKLPDLSNTIILNNSCYSGATVNEIKNGNINGVPVNLVKTETVANAFLGRNPIAYYGWNHDDLSAGPLGNDIAAQAEENLVRRLADADSTGIAYRRADDGYFEFSAPPKYPRILRLNHFNNDSYCYQDPCEETFTDPRDGQTYKIVCIGDQVWMAENLNFKSDDSWCYADNPNNCEIYGRLYSSESVKSACPPGWHLPSVEEYEKLNNLYPKGWGGAELKSVTGWSEPNTGANNNSGWSGLPGGQKNLLLDLYLSMSRYGYWWTSSTLFSSDAQRTRYVRLSYNKVILGILGSGPEDGAVAYSCRCVEDD